MKASLPIVWWFVQISKLYCECVFLQFLTYKSHDFIILGTGWSWNGRSQLRKVMSSGTSSASLKLTYITWVYDLDLTGSFHMSHPGPGRDLSLSEGPSRSTWVRGCIVPLGAVFWYIFVWVYSCMTSTIWFLTRCTCLHDMAPTLLWRCYIFPPLLLVDPHWFRN